MSIDVSTGNYAQAFWPGRGGGILDDCVILADFRAATAVNPGLRVPSIAAYRNAAGVPDTDQGIEGLTLDDSMEAIAALWPDVHADKHLGTWAAFASALKAGAIASASVLSSYLPEALRYGFKLNHRIVVYWNGSNFRILNPLAPPHSKPQTITATALRTAMAKYPYDQEAAAILFWPAAA